MSCLRSHATQLVSPVLFAFLVEVFELNSSCSAATVSVADVERVATRTVFWSVWPSPLDVPFDWCSLGEDVARGALVAGATVGGIVGSTVCLPSAFPELES